MSHRCRLNGYSTNWSNKDLSNAFPSTSWDLLEPANTLLLEPQDINFGRARFREATIQLPASDGVLVVRPRCGALMGDLRGEALYDTLDTDRLLVAECPITGTLLDLSLTKHADDLTKMHIAGGPSGNMLDAGLSELSSANGHSN
eukprot:4446660-Pyramimonas_sp.AAC.1